MDLRPSRSARALLPQARVRRITPDSYRPSARSRRARNKGRATPVLVRAKHDSVQTQSAGRASSRLPMVSACNATYEAHEQEARSARTNASSDRERSGRVLRTPLPYCALSPRCSPRHTLIGHLLQLLLAGQQHFLLLTDITQAFVSNGTRILNFSGVSSKTLNLFLELGDNGFEINR
jgi:hypothetical protein